MILARLQRWQGLLAIFAAQLVFGIVVAPVIFVPVLIEENSAGPAQALREYGEYLWTAFSFNWTFEGDGSWIAGAFALAWALLAVAFISPIVGPAKRESVGRSLWPSVIAAATLGAFITAMLFVAVVEGGLALASADQPDFAARYDRTARWIWLAALAVWCASGAAWAYLLRRSGRSRDPGGLDRLLRMVFAGTAVELALGLPIYLMARKKYDCYCAMATFLNLVMGIVALCWLCGPCTMLLMTREVRRNWSRGACPACGYPRRSGGTTCSECGNPLTA